MLISNLQNILNLTATQLAADNQLDIEVAALGEVAGSIYGTSPIQISSASLEAGGNANSKAIQGRSHLPQLQEDGDMSELVVWLQVNQGDRGTITGRLIYQLPESWAFRSSFPTLPLDYDVSKENDTEQQSALETLALRNRYFIFSNQIEQDYNLRLPNTNFTFTLGVGLNFVSEWIPSGALGILESLIALDTPLTIHGLINLAGIEDSIEELPIGTFPWDLLIPPPGIYLKADLGIDIGISAIVGLQQTRFLLYSPISDTWWRTNPSYGPEMAFAGALNIPSAGIAPTVSARKMMGVEEELMIKGAFQEDGLTLAKMADWVGLSAGDNTLTTLLPGPIQEKIGSIGLKYTASALVKQNSAYRVAYTFFVFEMPNIDWAVFGSITGLENLLVLRELDVEMIAFSPFDSANRSFSGNLIGKATILGAPVEVVVGLPGFFISAELSEQLPIPIQQFFDEYIPVLSPPAALTIDDFRLRAEPGNFYSFSLSLSGDWNISIGEANIALNQLGLSLMKIVGEGRPSGTFSGTITLLEGSEHELGLNVLLTMPADAELGYECSARSSLDTSIAVGTLLGNLATELGFSIQIPESLAGFKVQNIAISFNTQSKDFFFTCEGLLPLDGEEVNAGRTIDITLTIDLRNQADGSYTQQFSGIVKIDGLEFDLAIERQRSAGSTTSLLVADFYSAEGIDINAKGLIGDYMPADTPEAVMNLMEGLSFTLHDALLAIQKTGTGGSSTTQVLFVLDLGSGFDLSALPLVGKKLTGPNQAKLAYRVLIASAAFSSDSLQQINALLPSSIGALPTENQAGGDPVAAGLDLIASMQLGQQAIELSLPIALNGNSPTPPDVPVAPGAAANASLPVQASGSGDNSIKWIAIQKAVGPITFERVGVQYQNKILWLLLDSSLGAGGLTLSLDGLGAGSPLDRFEPRFRLSGIGIDYQNGPVEIGGSLIKNPNPPTDVAFAFDGAAVIKTEVFSLEAIGAYAQLKTGEPSMSLYAMLDYPLGGPSFFFVTGLAVGFGYNRALIVPKIDALETYPLLQVAKGEAALGELAQNFAQFIPIEVGQFFLAIGLKFTSFKQIDSFALLTINFGQHFELDIIGNAYTQIPAKIPGNTTPPLAVVDMDFKIAFIPDEGFLSVEAQLTSKSHILSEKCVLQGGYAFYSWFSGPHGGDFVSSLGGYHPDFKVPAHYPRVPRLGFHWQVTDELSLKGGFYFALTAHALMAGGFLKASYVSGHLEAHFKAGADFLISWQPYHYDAHMYLEIGGSYTLGSGVTSLTISVDLSADLHIWGPEFSGTAEIDLSVASVEVSFGAENSLPPKPINWAKFRDSFLPEDSEWVSIAVEHGLLKNVTEGNETIWVVNPKVFSFVTNSVVPATETTLGAFTLDTLYFKDAQKHIPQPITLDLFQPYDDADRATLEAFLHHHQQSFAPSASTTALRAQANAFIAIQLTHSRDFVPFGMEAMGLNKNGISTATQSIEIHQIEGENRVPKDIDFQFTPILKDMPSGLWGEAAVVGQAPVAKVNGKSFVQGLFAGFEIRPAKPPTPGETHSVELSKLQYHLDAVSDAFKAPAFSALQVADSTPDTDIEERTRLLTSLGALGFDDPVDLWTTEQSSDFTRQPQVATVVS